MNAQAQTIVAALKFVRDTLQKAANDGRKPGIRELNEMLLAADGALEPQTVAPRDLTVEGGDAKLVDWLRMMSEDGNVHPVDQQRLLAASKRLASLTEGAR